MFFLKIKSQQRMLQTSKWPKYLKGGFNFINQSAHENKKKFTDFLQKELTTGKEIYKIGN